MSKSKLNRVNVVILLFGRGVVYLFVFVGFFYFILFYFIFFIIFFFLGGGGGGGGGAGGHSALFRWRLGIFLYQCNKRKDPLRCHSISPNKQSKIACVLCEIPTSSVTYPYIVLFCTETLQWRHNERDGTSDHQTYDCLLNRLCRRRSTRTSKICVTGLCAGNSPVTGEFPAQRTSDTENVSIWWRHHVTQQNIYDKSCCHTYQLMQVM